MVAPLQLKKAEDIRDDILAEMVALTNLNDKILGAVLRQMAFAVGSELDEFYYQLWRAMNATYIKKAEGEALDDRGADFGVTRRAAQAAVGSARFTATGATTIPQGTLISAPATTSRDQVQFRTLAEKVVAGAGNVDVTIEAVETGSGGNLAASSISQIDTPVASISDVTNPAATTLGREIEDDNTYRERILATLDGLSAATIWAIRAEALNFEVQELTLQGGLDDSQTYLEVVEDLNTIPLSILSPNKIKINEEVCICTGIDTSVDPHRITGLTRGAESTTATDHADGSIIREWIPSGRGTLVSSVAVVESPGLIETYIDDGTTSGAHSQLVDLVGRRLKGDGTERDPGVRPGGVTLNCQAAGILLVNVAVQIQSKSGYNHAEVVNSVQTALTNHLNAKRIGEEVDGYALASVILGVPGVETIISGSLSINSTTFDGTDSSDVSTSNTQVARAGAISVS